MFTTLSYSTKGLHLVLALTLGTCAVGVAVVVLCVCMYVCLSVCYCVAFAENTSFKSCGMIFLPLQPSWLLDELLMDKGAVMVSFQQDQCIGIAIGPITRLTCH